MEDGGKITIATTRPELLPACVGIFVHPNDKRYKNLIGKNAIVPLFDLKVPIMEDEKVDMEFGTGIVMICTFGDTTDIEWWKKHKLPLRICITEDGKLNEKAGKYCGLTLEEAKEAIINDLEVKNRVVKKEKLQQTVGTCWRCNTPIEYLVTKQWFIKTLEFKEELIKQGRKIRWYPEFYRKRYEDWVKNLSWDWCISRQRFYGVPIPVWYCKNCGNVILPDEKDLPVDPEIDLPKKNCEKCGSNEFIPEKDVFDTWMTSSMSPEIAVRWLEKPERFKKMFPMSLRPQSHDIIRTWAFYTILKAFLHFNEIPWRDIAIGTFVLDPKGRGMHKSKGNAIWTEDLLKKYKSVDVIRYWVGTATWGKDLPFKEKELVRGKKFLTKLWNASRFCFMHIDEKPEKPKKLEAFDKWLLAKLNKLISNVTKNFYEYNTSFCLRETEEFFWHVFCDNYLEIVKDRLYNKARGEDAKISAKYTLYYALLSILKLLAPIIPHITEELYQRGFRKFEEHKSIHISDWPKKFEVEDYSEIGDKIVEIVSEVRKFKTSNKKSLKAEIDIVIQKDLEKDFSEFLEDFKAVTNAKNLSFGENLKISFL